MRSGPRHTGDAAPRRAFVDSGVWIAYFSRRDGHHAEADRLVRLAFSRRTLLVTTSLVLAEVHRWLLFRAGPRPAAAALDRIEAGAVVTITFPTEAHHRAGRQWLAKLADQRLSYTDAVSFAVMEATQCRVAMSFDRDFVVAGFQTWRLPE